MEIANKQITKITEHTIGNKLGPQTTHKPPPHRNHQRRNQCKQQNSHAKANKGKNEQDMIREGCVGCYVHIKSSFISQQQSITSDNLCGTGGLQNGCFRVASIIALIHIGLVDSTFKEDIQGFLTDNGIK
jgi:hypothetical protein